MVNGIMAPTDVHILTSRTQEYASLHSEMDVAEMITLGWEEYPDL